MKLWDTAGLEKYRSLTKLYYKNSHIIILVYDITNQKSFDELEYWANEINKEIKNEHIIAIVGNKIDLFDLEEVDEDKAKDYAQNKSNGNFKLVSAKENPKAFINFLEELLNNFIKIGKKEIEKSKNVKVKLNRKKKKGEGCC